MIFEVISEAVNDAVAQYLDLDYVPGVIADWARREFHSAIEPQDLRDNEFAILETVIRDRSREEAKSSITTSLSEFMDPDAQAEDWDYNGLAKWAEEAFDVRVNSGQLKQMDREQIREALIEAATEQIERKDCEGLRPFLVKNYAHMQLADWANTKFDVAIKPEETRIGEPATADATAAGFSRGRTLRVSAARGEAPIEYVLGLVDRAGGPENIYASEELSTWVNKKYSATLAGTDIRATPRPELIGKLVAISKSSNESIDQEISAAVERLPESNQLAAWVSNRLQIPLSPQEFDGESMEDRRVRLVEWGHAFLRQELTEMERKVLLQIFDTTWKDHLYGMDLLRESIGLRGIAERDPRIEYKREGSRLFQEFMRSIRDRVTDLIFKVRLAQNFNVRDVYSHSVENAQQEPGYGVAQSPAAQEVRAERAGIGDAPPPIESREGNGSPRGKKEEPRPVTVVNESPKVGRNDPCPCGSGKKYKQCCGRPWGFR